MPWSIQPRNGKFCVVKKGASAPVPGGCHATRAKALAHQRALYANEPAMTAAPLKPPPDWFDVPEPDTPQPLRFHPDGQVTGHLALWDQCHVGFLPDCVRITRGDDFSWFHTGALETDDGAQVPIGKVVFDTKHADTYNTTQAAATRHYDDNGHVAAYVRAHEGRFGIWMSGAAKHDLSEIDLRDIRANPPSGDWRGNGRRLKLIAGLAVPIPGFPIPQVAIAASGDIPTALIMQGYTEDVADYEPRSKEYLRQRALIASSLKEEQ